MGKMMGGAVSTLAVFLQHGDITEVLKAPIHTDLWKCTLWVRVRTCICNILHWCLYTQWHWRTTADLPNGKRHEFQVSSVWRILLGGWVSFLQGYKDLGFSLLVIPAFILRVLRCWIGREIIKNTDFLKVLVWKWQSLLFTVDWQNLISWP